MNKSSSFELAKSYLGKTVKVVVDRPKGSHHPKHGFVYEANYGFVPETKAPDGEEIDAYYLLPSKLQGAPPDRAGRHHFLGVDKPVREGVGTCIAIIHRLNDDDDKLVVAPLGVTLSNQEIEKAIHFQEQFFKHKLLRGGGKG